MIATSQPSASQPKNQTTKKPTERASRTEEKKQPTHSHTHTMQFKLRQTRAMLGLASGEEARDGRDFG